MRNGHEGGNEQNEPLRIGMIGLDNSRVLAFAKLLNDERQPEPLKSASLVAAWQGAASADFAMSATRIDNYREALKNEHGVRMMDSLEEVAAVCDAWMLEAVDGRVHEELFARMVPYRKPIFVDKPFALDSKAAERMIRLAWEYETPFMSCSALRYMESLVVAMAETEPDAIAGADFHGPMPLEPTQPGYFWYGIHMAEMLFKAMGAGCEEVRAVRTSEHDVAIGVWRDGRIGTIRGYRSGNEAFGGKLHLSRGSSGSLSVHEGGKPFLAAMMEDVVQFFRSGRTPIDPAETLAIIRFLEAANDSIRLNQAIKLKA
ncbi:Gfo/Idh/MocA family oxidoreductase [Paenibacillus sp. HB172176]|uniref:Gfo/Idh/MocA family oxidoreductase n=1 Tax=Paenibacillus sp. HB172176 TaxID=2493690 RepID=UPI001F102BEA|nr:Gfo/Idh/MocA family oxidoreductase [Paenibacillus sp. HB172176]